MARTSSLIVMTALFTSLLFVQQGSSQDKKPAAEKAKAEATKAKPKGRLPNNFGKLDLDGATKQKIYDVQAKYEADEDKLEQQLAALRAKQMAEIEALLTPEQRTKLTELQEASRKKKQAAKEKDDAEEMADEKPAAPKAGAAKGK